MNIRLHHDREPGLVNPAATLQQRREERSLAQLQDPQLQIPGRRGESAGTGPVALRRPSRGPLERCCADERGRFRIDQLLV